MGDIKTNTNKTPLQGNDTATCQALAVAETAPQDRLQERAACLMDHYQKAIGNSYNPVSRFDFSFRLGNLTQTVSCKVQETVVHLDSQNALYGGLFTFDCERQITDVSQKESKILSETYEVGNLYAYSDPEMRDLPSSTPVVVSGESRITYSSLNTESPKK